MPIISQIKSGSFRLIRRIRGLFLGLSDKMLEIGRDLFKELGHIIWVTAVYDLVNIGSEIVDHAGTIHRAVIIQRFRYTWLAFEIEVTTSPGVVGQVA